MSKSTSGIYTFNVPKKKQQTPNNTPTGAVPTQSNQYGVPNNSAQNNPFRIPIKSSQNNPARVPINTGFGQNNTGFGQSNPAKVPINTGTQPTTGTTGTTTSGGRMDEFNAFQDTEDQKPQGFDYTSNSDLDRIISGAVEYINSDKYDRESHDKLQSYIESAYTWIDNQMKPLSANSKAYKELKRYREKFESLEGSLGRTRLIFDVSDYCNDKAWHDQDYRTNYTTDIENKILDLEAQMSSIKDKNSADYIRLRNSHDWYVNTLYAAVLQRNEFDSNFKDVNDYTTFERASDYEYTLGLQNNIDAAQAELDELLGRNKIDETARGLTGIHGAEKAFENFENNTFIGRLLFGDVFSGNSVYNKKGDEEAVAAGLTKEQKARVKELEDSISVWKEELAPVQAWQDRILAGNSPFNINTDYASLIAKNERLMNSKSISNADRAKLQTQNNYYQRCQERQQMLSEDVDALDQKVADLTSEINHNATHGNRDANPALYAELEKMQAYANACRAAQEFWQEKKVYEDNTRESKKSEDELVNRGKDLLVYESQGLLNSGKLLVNEDFMLGGQLRRLGGYLSKELVNENSKFLSAEERDTVYRLAGKAQKTESEEDIQTLFDYCYYLDGLVASLMAEAKAEENEGRSGGARWFSNQGAIVEAGAGTGTFGLSSYLLDLGAYLAEKHGSKNAGTWQDAARMWGTHFDYLDDRRQYAMQSLGEHDLHTDNAVANFLFGQNFMGTGESISQFIGEGVGTIANMAPGMMAGRGAGESEAIAKAISSIILGGSAANSAKRQARKEGYSEGRALTYGFIMGATEAASEYWVESLFGRAGISEGKLSKKAANIANPHLKKLAIKGARIFGEVQEEYMQNKVEFVVNDLVLHKYERFSLFDQDDWHTVLSTIFSTGLLETMGGTRQTTIVADKMGRALSGEEINGKRYSAVNEVGKIMENNENAKGALIYLASELTDPGGDMNRTKAIEEAKELAEGLESGKIKGTYSNIGRLYQLYTQAIGNGNQSTIKLIAGAIAYKDIQALSAENDAAQNKLQEVIKANPGAEVLDAIQTEVRGYDGTLSTPQYQAAADILNKASAGKRLTADEMNVLAENSALGKAARMWLAQHGANLDANTPLSEVKAAVRRYITDINSVKKSQKQLQKAQVVQAAEEAGAQAEVDEATKLNKVQPQEHVKNDAKGALYAAQMKADARVKALEQAKAANSLTLAAMSESAPDGTRDTFTDKAVEKLQSEIAGLMNQIKELQGDKVTVPTAETAAKIKELSQQRDAKAAELENLFVNALLRKAQEQQTKGTIKAKGKGKASEAIQFGNTTMTREEFVKEQMAKGVSEAEANEAFNNILAQSNAINGTEGNNENRNSNKERDAVGGRESSGENSEQLEQNQADERGHEKATAELRKKSGEVLRSTRVTTDATLTSWENTSELAKNYPRLAELSNTLKESGFTNVTYVTGGQLINSAGQNVAASYEGGELFLRLDYERDGYDYVATATHEKMHHLLRLLGSYYRTEMAGSKAAAEVRGFVTSALQTILGEDVYQEVFMQYAEVYGSAYAGRSALEIGHMIDEELLCDMIGGLDNFGAHLSTFKEDAEEFFASSNFDSITKALAEGLTPGQSLNIESVEANALPFGKQVKLYQEEADTSIPAEVRPESGEKEAHPKLSLFSIQSALSGANFQIQYNDMGYPYSVLDKNGNPVTHVTAEMMKNTPLGNLVQMAVDNGFISDQGEDSTADAEYQLLADIMNLIVEYKDAAMVWELVGSQVFSGIKANSDTQYNLTVDFGTICRKTQALVNAMSEAMKQLGRGLTRREVEVLYKKTGEAGEATPCPVCYVFSRWIGIGNLLDQINTFQNKFFDIDQKTGEAKLKVSEEELVDFMHKRQLEIDKYERDHPEKNYRDKNNVQKVGKILSDMKTSPNNSKRNAERALNQHQQALAYIEELNALADKSSPEKAKALRDLAKKFRYNVLSEKNIAKKEATIRQAEEDLAPYELFQWMNGTVLMEDASKIDANGEVIKTWKLNPDYKPVPQSILFDLNKGGDFAKNYPLTWAFRTGKGCAAGKAISPYSDARVGETIQAVASGNVKSIVPGLEFVKGEDGKWLGEYLDGDVKKQKYKLADAVRKMAQQNLIGGMRFQSTSDFRFEWGSDYFMTFLELQALGANVQLYTKVIEAVDFLASTGADCNLSVMALGDGFTTNEAGETVLAYSSVTGINAEEAIKKAKQYDNVQLILVGISDEHIKMALAGTDVTFVIPFHGSGQSVDQVQTLMDLLGENLDVTSAQDYSDVQIDRASTKQTPEQEAMWNLRVKIIRGGFEDAQPSSEEQALLEKNVHLQKLYNMFYVDEANKAYHCFLGAEQAEQIFPYEYWDTSLDYDHADENGEIFKRYCESMGIVPRFSGIGKEGKKLSFGNFAYGGENGKAVKGYWKLLIDRKMYSNKYDADGNWIGYGAYRDQKRIDVSNVKIETLDPSVADASIPESARTKAIHPERTQGIVEEAIKQMEAMRANGDIYDLKAIDREKFRPKVLEAQELIDEATRNSIQDTTAEQEDNGFRFSLQNLDYEVEPTSNAWQRDHTTAEVKGQFPDLWDITAEESEVRNPTQVKDTVKTYRKIYDILKAEGFNGKILDASSGLGYGTQAGREEYGFDVEDIEPYPDKSYTPKYTDYDSLNEKYDAIISNAVLNVLPQDQRDALVVKMGELLNPGGRIFINVRGDDVKTNKSNQPIGGKWEYYVASTGSYQKGFTKPELKAYLQDALGPGFDVQITDKYGKTSAIVTKTSAGKETTQQAEANLERLKGALDGRKISRNNTASGRKSSWNKGQLTEAIDRSYTADVIRDAGDRAAVADAIKAAGGIAQEYIQTESGDLITVQVVSPDFYTNEMIREAAANKEHGYDTKFFYGHPVYSGGEWSVAGFADTDHNVVYVRMNGPRGVPKNIGRKGYTFGEGLSEISSGELVSSVQDTYTVASMGRHERFHLLMNQDDPNATALLNFMFDFKNSEQFDGTNYWYQLRKAQDGYDFRDYMEEMAADVYSGDLSFANEETQRQLQQMVDKIDQDTEHGPMFSIQQTGTPIDQVLSSPLVSNYFEAAKDKSLNLDPSQAWLMDERKSRRVIDAIKKHFAAGNKIRSQSGFWTRALGANKNFEYGAYDFADWLFKGLSKNPNFYNILKGMVENPDDLLTSVAKAMNRKDSTKFSAEDPNYVPTELDEEYLEAVKNNDVATMSRIITDIAKKAGYENLFFQHDKGKRFEEFSKGDFGFHLGSKDQATNLLSKKPDLANAHLISLLADPGVSLNIKDMLIWRPMEIAENIVQRLKYNIPGQAGFDPVLEKLRPKVPLLKQISKDWNMYENSYDSEGRKRLTKIFDSVGINSLQYTNAVEAKDRNTDHTAYLFWDPTRLKSADLITYDKKGDIIPPSKRFDRSKGEFRFSIQDNGNANIIPAKQNIEGSQYLYSALDRAVDQKIGGKANVDQLISQFTNKNTMAGWGVKQDEIDARGLIPWLEQQKAEGKTKVTKEELKQFLAENPGQMEEHIRDNRKYEGPEGEVPQELQDELTAYENLKKEIQDNLQKEVVTRLGEENSWVARGVQSSKLLQSKLADYRYESELDSARDEHQALIENLVQRYPEASSRIAQTLNHKVYDVDDVSRVGSERRRLLVEEFTVYYDLSPEDAQKLVASWVNWSKIETRYETAANSPYFDDEYYEEFKDILDFGEQFDTVNKQIASADRKIYEAKHRKRTEYEMDRATQWGHWKMAGGIPGTYEERYYKDPNGPGYRAAGERKYEHNGSPDVVVHIRTQQFNDMDGGKALHVDEVQSDWHNEGGSEYYKGSKEEQERLQKESAQEYDKWWELTYNLSETRSRLIQEGNSDADIRQDVLGARVGDEIIPLSINRETDEDVAFYEYRLLEALKEAELLDESVMELTRISELGEGIFSYAEVKYLDENEDPTTLILEWTSPNQTVAEELKNIYTQQYKTDDLLKRARAQTPHGPYEGTAYITYAAKQLISQAIDNGNDKITWTSADQQGNRWSREFMGAYRRVYDELGRSLEKIAKQLKVRPVTGETIIGYRADQYASIEDYLDERSWESYDNDREDDFETHVVPYFAITPELVKAVKEKGLTRFSIQDQTTDEDIVEAAGDMRKAADLFPVDSLEHDLLNIMASNDADSLMEWVNQKMSDYRREKPQGEKPSGFVPKMTEDRLKTINGKIDELVDKYGALEEGDQRQNAEPFVIPAKTKDGNKMRKHVGTVGESTTVAKPLKPYVKEFSLTNVAATYVPESDKKHIRSAVNTLEQYGLERSLRRFEALTDATAIPSADTVALGEQLLIETAANGDTGNFLKVLAATCEMSSQLGKSLQAFSLLKKSGPIGQLYYIQKAVDRMNQKTYAKRIMNGKMSPILISDADVKAILTAATEKERDAAMDVLLQKIADQVPVTLADRWNAWRYLSMLGNPRTHIRNVIGNALFTPMIFAKNILASGGEALATKLGIMDESQRTKDLATTLRIDNTYRKLALDDANAMKKELQGNGKYNPANEIMQKRKVLPGFLDNLSKWNGEKLEQEDWIFLRKAYTAALSQALAHSGYTAEELQTTQEGMRALNEARRVAIQEAQRATYRDFSQVAAALNRFKQMDSGLGKIVGTAVEGVVPFTKTPINILKRGIEYSPIGLATSIAKAAKDVITGNYTNAAEVIDRLCAGLTGTGIAILGALLAKLGWIRGKKDDKEEEQFDLLHGFQDYSINIGNKSFTIDWAIPASLPLFTGVAAWQTVKGNDKLGLGDLWDACLLISEPMMSLSMLDGINKAFAAAAYADESAKVATVAKSAFGSYFGQAFPTILGQVARTIDPVRRTTYNDKNSGVSKDLQRFYQSNVAGKIPGLEQTKPEYVDRWGRTQTTGGVLARAFENFVLPGYTKTIEVTPLDEELQRLYEATGKEKHILPPAAFKDFTVGGQTYNLTADEYVAAAKDMGQMNYRMLNDVIYDQRYLSLTDDEKAVALGYFYEYTANVAKWNINNNYKLGAKWIGTARDAANERARQDIIWQQAMAYIEKNRD